jgi:Tfp pilus assembly protein PilV
MKDTRRMQGKDAGFGLVEALVAAGVVVVGVASLAQLFVVAANTSRTARTISITTILAQQKMESLLGQPGGPDPSPPDALSRDADGYYEYLDASGEPLPARTSVPDDAVYVCRWSAALAAGGRTLVVQVWVGPRATLGTVGSTTGASRLVSAKRMAS